MAVSGAAGLVYAVAHASGARADARRLAEEPAVLGRAVVMCVLGGVILVQGHASISFVGVMWGLLGLYKAADEIDEVVHALKGRRPFALKLAFTVFEMVLAVLLIISPFANIEHHVLLLGLELIDLCLFHPDYTVGSGIAPESACNRVPYREAFAGSRTPGSLGVSPTAGLPPVRNCTSP